jgi:adenylate cyclase
LAHRPETPVAPQVREGERRLTAIAFTDIVGYSGVVHRDEKLGQRMVDRQDRVVRAVLPLFGGHVVKSTGDGFLLAFGSALSAVKALVTIQTRIATDDQATASPMTLRTSVHLGDVDHVRGDLYGDGVNIAARLMPLSPEGGIAISATVLMQVRQQLDLEWRSIGTPPLKNIVSPLEIFVADPPAVQALGKVLEAETPAVVETSPDPARRRLAWVRIAAVAGVVLV